MKTDATDIKVNMAYWPKPSRSSLQVDITKFVEFPTPRQDAKMNLSYCREYPEAGEVAVRKIFYFDDITEFPAPDIAIESDARYLVCFYDLDGNLIYFKEYITPWITKKGFVFRFNRLLWEAPPHDYIPVIDLTIQDIKDGKADNLIFEQINLVE
jgi:hypothetical protein